METFCSLCNGIESKLVTCDYCGQIMVNQGRLVDYYGPYSPYTSQDSEGSCVHLFYCPYCRNDQRIAIPLKNLSSLSLAE
ncbi:MAG: hypothetical protein E6713_13690 [Sporomusaceae bacterium]|nr:hypothetical protein [Sporomusaceae bacterium]